MAVDTAVLAEIAKQAGELIIRRFEQLTSSDVFFKSSETDIVTIADRESENFIRTSLKQAFPDIAFYGEEGDYGDLDKYERVFIVDPIDGTTNYLHGYPDYCISIGLRECGKTTAGVVHMPRRHETYSAVLGGGAYRDGRRLHVSRVSEFIGANVATGYACLRGKLPVNNIPVTVRILPMVQGFRRSGSAAIDLCHVADGSVDVYWEFLLKPWDYEAARLVVQEAGGMVTGFDGFPVDDHVGRIIASNGLLHEKMLRIISEEVTL